MPCQEEESRRPQLTRSRVNSIDGVAVDVEGNFSFRLEGSSDTSIREDLLEEIFWDYVDGTSVPSKKSKDSSYFSGRDKHRLTADAAREWNERMTEYRKERNARSVSPTSMRPRGEEKDETGGAKQFKNKTLKFCRSNSSGKSKSSRKKKSRRSISELKDSQYDALKSTDESSTQRVEDDDTETQEGSETSETTARPEKYPLSSKRMSSSLQDEEDEENGKDWPGIRKLNNEQSFPKSRTFSTLCFFTGLFVFAGILLLIFRKGNQRNPTGDEPSGSVFSNKNIHVDPLHDEDTQTEATTNESMPEETMLDKNKYDNMSSESEDDSTESLTSPSQELLSLLNTASSSDIKDTGSAAHKAARWLFYEDAFEPARKYNAQTASLDVEDRIVQRFSLASFYFSSSGLSSASTELVTASNWLSSAHECEWEGISCGTTGTKENLIVKLDVSQRGFGGRIPEEILSFRELEHLLLHDNDFNGPIPSWMGDMMSLETIYLNNNLLSGSLPENLSLLPLLRELWLEGNLLTGVIHQGFCDMNLPVLMADCLGDNPRIFCSCCSSCFP